MNTRFLACWAIGLACSTVLAGPRAALPASQAALEVDRQVDWQRARLIAVQDAGRYKTLDSFARESMTAMYGYESLPGLSPLGSLLDWSFRRDAYVDEPVVKIRDKGLRIEFSAHLSPADRDYIIRTGYMTPRQLSSRTVQNRIQELEPRFSMVSAIRRVRDAQVVVGFLDELMRIVPPAEGARDALWHTPAELVPNLTGQPGPDGQPAVEGFDAQQAMSVIVPWSSLRESWLRGDAAGVQKYLDQLAETLPKLAAQGVYPAEGQRAAEAHYYAMGKFTWGWMIYFVATLAAVVLLVTNWPAARALTIVLLLAALALHAYGLGLRWYILGRIPVANMFEAVVASAWIGIALGLLAEVRYRTAVFALGACVTGFFALVLGQYVIPGGGTLTTIMGILDDVMLRIHTVLIIASYALIFLASIIAIAYLIGYYFHTAPDRSAYCGLATALVGGALYLSAGSLFEAGPIAGSLVKPVEIQWASAALAILIALQVGLLVWQRWSGFTIALTAILLTGATTMAVGNHMFIRGTGLSLLGTGLAWAAINGFGMLWRAFERRPALAGAAGSLRVPEGLALAGAGPLPRSELSATALKLNRPILAGAAPGDEGLGAKLPHWLHTADWSQMITLNMVFVMLFVGIILGAVWADYSWGRPWGWDPKEVFAMNTWIIYAVLIHTRFLVRQKGLWTAWLSVAGCLMMAFNWCFVNFYIVGLHSYA